MLKENLLWSTKWRLKEATQQQIQVPVYTNPQFDHNGQFPKYTTLLQIHKNLYTQLALWDGLHTRKSS